MSGAAGLQARTARAAAESAAGIEQKKDCKDKQICENKK